MTKVTFGDVVWLASGGPPMTVNGEVGDSVICLWFSGDERKEGKFSEDALVKIDPTKSAQGKAMAPGTSPP